MICYLFLATCFSWPTCCTPEYVLMRWYVFLRPGELVEVLHSSGKFYYGTKYEI